jgi:hypothetical protein
VAATWATVVVCIPKQPKSFGIKNSLQFTVPQPGVLFLKAAE